MDSDPGQGTSTSFLATGDWFIEREAQCSDHDSSEEEIESPEVTDLVDNCIVSQGNSLALFQQQEREVCELQVQALKRKLGLSPEPQSIADLSPSLSRISLSPTHKPLVKRRLFSAEEDGERSYETPNTIAEAGHQVSKAGGGVDERLAMQNAEPEAPPDNQNMHLYIMRARSQQAAMLGLFKETFSLSFNELTRPFRSNRTTNPDWVIAVFGVRECFYETAKETFKTHCEFSHLTLRPSGKGNIFLALCLFKNFKNRDTVKNLCRSILNVTASAMLCDPPKIRSPAAALFWYKSASSNAVSTQGPYPDWLASQVLVGHQRLDEGKFELTPMIQWAYDYGYVEEDQIAFEYAKLASVDANAAAWLASAGQAKYVKDCSTMVRYYRRAESQALSTSAYIDKRCKLAEEGGNWKVIAGLLKYQGIETITFIQALRHWLRGVPKKSCMVFWGPSDTGKSQFCSSLTRFLGGKHLSYVNAKSHFWLSPLAEARFAFLDDATTATWNYFDVYMRNFLDGYPVCIDRKHRHAVECKAPPMLVTTNLDMGNDTRWPYLQSRLTLFSFKNPFPLDEQNRPLFKLTDENWASFFTRLWGRLELSDQEDEGEDDCSAGALRLCPRAAAANNRDRDH
ncbi:putative E1 [Equus asinus papillomavirus 1]|uniref:Replication protein E1 n=1 Tax=Equus asinus papillomavirus 1 TaxID=1163703 RepID=W6A1G2_9PAPI|nr:putative E1 [Equus asinus papillomavirus 1]AHI45083.1 putative E1 [Equus asinus papillomavirus 1]